MVTHATLQSYGSCPGRCAICGHYEIKGCFLSPAGEFNFYGRLVVVLIDGDDLLVEDVLDPMILLGEIMQDFRQVPEKDFELRKESLLVWITSGSYNAIRSSVCTISIC